MTRNAHGLEDFRDRFCIRIPAKGQELELLLGAMQRIGLLSIRDDGRIDIPDLFRVAALMLKKGGIPPRQKNY